MSKHARIVVAGDWLVDQDSIQSPYVCDSIRFAEAYEAERIVHNSGLGVEFLATRPVVEAIVAWQHRYAGTDAAMLYWSRLTPGRLIVIIDEVCAEFIDPDENGLYRVGFGWSWHVEDAHDRCNRIVASDGTIIRAAGS